MNLLLIGEYNLKPSARQKVILSFGLILLLLLVKDFGLGQNINSAANKVQTSASFNLWDFLSSPFRNFKSSTSNNVKLRRNDCTDVYQAQSKHLKHVEVLVTATVYKMLPSDHYGIPHERFLIKLNNNTTVLIAHNLNMAPSAPLKSGQEVTIKGEYIWNNLGGVIHWTHHTDTPYHVGGYILSNGMTYK